jgi:pSer/pThr/pTyr-binding forkhead associated (FHA) protein
MIAPGILLLVSLAPLGLAGALLALEHASPNGAPSARLPRAGRIRIVAGALSGTTASLNQPVLLGRDAKANLVFPDDRDISRKHCEVSFDKETGQFFVQDLNSTNGTYLAGSLGQPAEPLPPYQSCIVPPGHEVVLGSSRNRFVVEPE